MGIHNYDPPIYIPSDFAPEMVLVRGGQLHDGRQHLQINIRMNKPTHKVTFTHNFYRKSMRLYPTSTRVLAGSTAGANPAMGTVKGNQTL